jgi:hypothetical protein
MIDKIGNKITQAIQKISRKASSCASEAPKLKQPLIINVFIKSDGSPKDTASKIFDSIENKRLSKARKKFKHIDFTPAKSLKEAHKFSRKLGVLTYDIGENDTLEVINYLNEGFATFKNQHYGLAQVPMHVIYRDMRPETLMSAIKQRGIFVINNVNFGVKTINEHIQAKIDDIVDAFCEITPDGVQIPDFYANSKDLAYIKKLIDSFNENPDALSYGQKVELYTILEEMEDTVSEFVYETKDFAKRLFAQEDKFINFSESQKQEHLNKILSSESKTDAIGYLANALAKVEETFGIKATNKKHSTLFHEMGHLQDYFENRPPAKGKFEEASQYPLELAQWLEDEEKQNIAFSVSNYATTGPGEFIAEVYSKLLSGESVPKKAQELYKQMRGPRIPDII